MKEKLKKQIERLSKVTKKYVGVNGESFKVTASQIELQINPYSSCVSIHGTNTRNIKFNTEIEFNGCIIFELFDKEQRKYLNPWVVNAEKNTIPKNVEKMLIPFLAQINQLIENQLNKRTDLVTSEIEAQLKAWVYSKKDITLC